MKTEILRQLKEAGDFISGQELCEQYQVSRTAVWKVVRQLQEEGYEIEAVRNRGYRLSGSVDVLSEAELTSSIRGSVFGRPVVYVKTVDSTNNLAKQLAEEGAPHGTLVVADTQSAGKGRRGRGWSSQPGTGIWMSIILRPSIPTHKVSALTLVAAMAVRRGLNEIAGVESWIKWPNDIVINGRKVCGILTEMSSDMDGIHYIVTGIGINANQIAFPDELCETATSVRIQTGLKVNRSELIGDIMKRMEGYYESFLQQQDMSILVEEYNMGMINRNREVVVMELSGNWNGTAIGINQDGELLIETKEGEVRKVFSGEVSVRGIYGYV